MALIIVPFVFGYGFSGVGGGPAQMGEATIGHVDDQDITMADFARYVQREMNTLRQQGNEDPSQADLLTGGALNRIRKEIFQEKLIEREIARAEMSFDVEFLQEQMKKYAQFQNEDGSFNADAWNSFVSDRTVDWNVFYEELTDAWQRNLYFTRVTGAARVLERDLREEFAGS